MIGILKTRPAGGPWELPLGTYALEKSLWPDTRDCIPQDIQMWDFGGSFRKLESGKLLK